MKTKQKNKGLTVGEIATYSLGSLGSQFSNNCVNAFFLVYLCIYQGLKPIPMTIAFVLAKAWDAVFDPMIATVINNSRKTKFGRFRPWILCGAIVNAITLVFMFFPLSESVPIALKYAFYIVMFILWSMSFSVVDVPFWSMLPTIANSTDERNKATSMAKLIGGFGGFLVGMVGTSLILPMFSNRGAKTAYMILGLTSGVIMIVFITLMVVCNRERYNVPHNSVSIKDIFQVFKDNDQLGAYAVNLLLFLTGTTIATSQILYLFIYCYQDGANFLDSRYSYTLFWIIACTGQGIAMFFYNQITKKIPREKLYAWSFFFCIISYALLFTIFFFLKPGNYLLNAILVALSGAFLMTASGINQIGSTVMVADIVDYGEYKTGRRGDSVIFSIQTLVMKFAGAIAMLILGLGITTAQLPTISELPIINSGKYVESVNVFTNKDGKYLINNKETYDKVVKADNKDYQKKAELVTNNLISEKSLTVLRVFMFLIPIPMCLIGYFIYKKKYWLYGEKYDKIKAEIDRRRAESGIDEFGNVIEKDESDADAEPDAEGKKAASVSANKKE